MLGTYTFKWILQRITAVLLIPLSFWFIYQCIAFQKFNYEDFQFFFQSYFNSFLFGIMMIVMLLHAKLGCETIVKDYISIIYLQKIFKIFINLITIISLFLVIIAIIKLSLFNE